MDVERTDEREEFSALYREHYGAVLRYCRRRTDEETARDAVAETFLVAWRRREVVPQEPLPWLYGVARRVLANAARGAGRQQRLTNRLAEEARGAAEQAPSHDAAAHVLAALRELSPADQELLRLATWEGLDYRQIAAVLGIRSGAAAVRLHRARRRLQALLDPEVSSRPARPTRTEAAR